MSVSLIHGTILPELIKHHGSGEAHALKQRVRSCFVCNDDGAAWECAIKMSSEGKELPAFCHEMVCPADVFASGGWQAHRSGKIVHDTSRTPEPTHVQLQLLRQHAVAKASSMAEIAAFRSASVPRRAASFEVLTEF